MLFLLISQHLKKPENNYYNLTLVVQITQIESNICYLCRLTLLSPTSEVGSPNPVPYVGKLVFSCHWSAVYSTEP